MWCLRLTRRPACYPEPGTQYFSSHFAIYNFLTYARTDHDHIDVGATSLVCLLTESGIVVVY